MYSWLISIPQAGKSNVSVADTIKLPRPQVGSMIASTSLTKHCSSRYEQTLLQKSIGV